MTQRGFVQKRGAKWTAYYYVVSAGRRRQRSKGGFATKREAVSYLNTTLEALQKGELVETSKITLAEYLRDRWLPIKRHSLKPSTYDSYRRVLDRHVIPHLGSLQLQQLTAQHLDDLYASLLESGSHRGGGLSPKTVRYVHTTVQKALRDAERKQLVQRNVALGADAPRVTSGREMRTWTPEQLQTFLRGIREHRLFAAYLLAATTGMRRGEVLGLRWGDLDWAGRRLLIRQTLLSINYKLSFGTPKTARSRRSIALDPMTLSALQNHRRTQHEERALIGQPYNDRDLVFARPDGEPVHPDYYSQLFDRTVKRLRLPKIRLHDLRHTYATLALAAGVPAKVISDRLGHSTVAFTQDIYMHVVPELEAAAADHVATVVLGPVLAAAIQPATVEALEPAATLEGGRTDEGS